MIFHYGITKIGFYHIERGIVCQDYHLVKQIDKHLIIAAVADGLGSETHSDIASKIACEEALSYCEQHINRKSKDEEILKTIKESFHLALNTIKQYGQDNNIPLDQLDTTLVVSVYRHGHLYFGNSGDSGIVVLNSDGTYQAVTEKQNDENGCVFPLCFGEEKWEFGERDNVASVLMATDGIFDLLFPYLLNDQDIKIYVPLCEYLMNNESLHFSNRSKDKVCQKMEAFIDSLTKEEVNDDKTIVVMLDTSIKVTRQDDSYYATPNWAELKRIRDEKYFKEAYPSLFEKQNNEESDNEEKE